MIRESIQLVVLVLALHLGIRSDNIADFWGLRNGLQL
jgi:hypothetical protein